jgi:hypothetical protein
MYRRRNILAVLFVLAAVLAVGRIATAADEEQPWDRTFKGHEMWMLSIDSAFAISQAANKPLLIDFWKHG